MKLYYIHDPMCSWCWGFRPTWAKIRKSLSSEVEISYVLGGLAADSDEPMSESMKNEIAGYWRKIQKHIPETRFNFDFWQECIPKRSTYPACRAVIAARKQDPAIEQDMVEAIQQAYYLQAKNPSEKETLIALALSLGLDKATFKQDLTSDNTQSQLEKEILFSRQIGARGFPSMVLEKEGRYSYVPLDYNDPTEALVFIRSLIR